MKDKRLFKSLQVILVIVLAFSLYGCSAQKSARNESAAAAPEMATESQTSEMMQDTAGELKSKSDVAQGDNPNINTEIDYNRKMIKTGELQLQTKEFKKSVEDLVAKIVSLGGYVESSHVDGANFYSDYNNRKSASLVIRIPQKNFDNFINNSSEFGNVVYSTSNSQDITSQYVDTEIRLKSLRTRHERLIALLEQSGSLKDLFAIEQELGDVTYEIEKLSGTLQDYDHLVDMSTINIMIEEVYKIDEVKHVITFADRIEDTFKESIKGLISILQGLVLIAVAFTPFLVIIIPIVIVVIVVVKKNISRKKVKIEPNEEKK